jgi:hypothetical protein
MSRFSKILQILDCAFTSGMTQQNYHDIVICLRDYHDRPDPPSIEEYELQQLGWPVDYHPCDHMENIRWGTVILGERQSNKALNKKLQDYKMSSL